MASDNMVNYFCAKPAYEKGVENICLKIYRIHHKVFPVLKSVFWIVSFTSLHTTGMLLDDYEFFGPKTGKS